MASSTTPFLEAEEDVSDDPAWKRHLHLAHRILLPAILVYIMLAMGCAITFTDLLKHLRKPYGVFIGAVCQFVAMPLVGFTLANICDLATAEALGLILMACSPAGGMSNLFTYWVQGDVSLSVCMTTVSTVLALGMMPLNLFIYSKAWNASHPPHITSTPSPSSIQSTPSSVTADFITTTSPSDTVVFSANSIPYDKILITLASTLLPVLCGIFIRRKWPKAAIIITKLGTLAGLLAISAAVTMQAFLYKWYTVGLWQVWVAPGLLSLAGFISGFLLACLFRLPFKLQRTVGFETGSQNVSLAISVVILAFPKHVQGRIILVQVLYGVFLPFTGGGLVLLYYAWKKIFKTSDDESDSEKSSTGTDNIIYKKGVLSEVDSASFSSSVTGLGLKNVALSHSVEYITNV